MVSIYCNYVWRNKPIVVKGSLNRYRNYQYVDDVVNILFKTISNNKLKKNEIFNLTTGRVTKVKELIDIILRVNKKKLKVVKKKKIQRETPLVLMLLIHT